jgi:pimeloyl-ACP methyl ester carboxylesterase
MSYWRHVVPLLTPHYTVIAVDNRGSGGSQTTQAETINADLLAFRQA